MLEKLHEVRAQLADFLSGPVDPYPTIELCRFRPYSSVNFGDELAHTIVVLMLARKGRTRFDEVARPRRLISVGSILHCADNDSVVWGTGRNSKVPDELHIFDRLDVRAVRGPRTRKFLTDRSLFVPKVFGDPALLLPILSCGRFTPTAERKVVLVPNLHDYDHGFDSSKIAIPVLDPRQSWNRVVSEIVRYEFVLASSLHGLVVAESFGIPARYVRLTESEGLLKYHDYYEGTGRTLGKYARSIEEGLDMGGKEPPLFDANELMDSFPYDIWD